MKGKHWPFKAVLTLNFLAMMFTYYRIDMQIAEPYEIALGIRNGYCHISSNLFANMLTLYGVCINLT